MFETGQPIQDRSEDSLGRWLFAESLGKAILSYDKMDSIAIGLYGSWGTGKTSVLNLVKEYIEDKSTALDLRRKPLVINFSPWHYSDQNQLIAMFFKDMSAAMRHTPGYEKGEQIAELLDDMYLYFLGLAPLTLVNPKIGLLVGAGSGFFKALSKLIKYRSSKQGRDLTALKDALDNELLRQGNKVIIIIDDIDRLNSAEIRQMFQLVKSLADFKNTIYLLAFDKQVAIDALGEVQKASGQLYLEKIIPVCFDIVSPDQSHIRQQLHDRLEQIVADAWDEKVWVSLYEHQLRYFFSTLRDVSRFLNTFDFGYRLLMDDTRFEDLAVITAVQVHEPTIYSEIHRNRSLFSGQYRGRGISATGKDEDDTELKEQLKQECEKILKRSVKVSVEQLRQIMGITFPRIAEIYSTGPGKAWDIEPEMRQEKRICSPEYFSRYFKLVLSADEFSQKEIDLILSRTADAQQFLGELLRLKDENRLDEFLDTLKFLDRSSLTFQQISTVMNGLLKLDVIYSTTQRGRRGWPVAAQISDIVSAFSRSLDSLEKRFQVLSDAILTSKANKSIYAVVWAISDEHKVHEDKAPESVLPKFQLELFIIMFQV